MVNNHKNTRIYKAIAKSLEAKPQTKEELIESSIVRLIHSDKDEISDQIYAITRGKIGAAINQMVECDLLIIDKDGLCRLSSPPPIVIKLEECEAEILKELSAKSMNKSQIKDALKITFGTHKTTTKCDDNVLTNYIGQLLKSMIANRLIVLKDGNYTLSPKISARADNLTELIELKKDFIARLYAKGGEFFEGFFMTLIKKYYEKHHFKVLECYVTGGAHDGGIDGVIVTEDKLGFKEKTLVQTKNRTDITNETVVRSFYGAVCANKGSRGIFVTTSDYHESARAFLDKIDNCVGLSGSNIFSLALECNYGIKKVNGKLEIDEKIFRLTK